MQDSKKSQQGASSAGAGANDAAQKSKKGQLKQSLKGMDYDQGSEALGRGGPASQQAPTGGQTAAKAGGAGPAPAPTAPTPLASDERVLSSDPQYADTSYVPWFRDQVRDKVQPWGLGFDPGSVRCASVSLDGKAARKAITLKWNATWGTPPLTTELGRFLTPLDARAAVAATHKLAGFQQVAPGDQTILDNLLGGETNEVSKSVRETQRPQHLTLAGKTAEEQQAALAGLITAKDALPGVGEEQIATTGVQFALSGPTEKKDYAFRGRTGDAEEWIAQFVDGTKVTLVAPKAPEPGYHNYSVQQAAEAASFMPKASRALVNTVVLNAVVNPDDAHWAVEYNRPDFHSYMTAGAAGVVTIYPNKVTDSLIGENYMRVSMLHEAGHTWSYQAWGTDETKGKWVDWKKAMDADKVALSGYAMAAIAEDVAETVKAYGSTKGTPKFEEYKNLVPNRFAMLDKEMPA